MGFSTYARNGIQDGIFRNVPFSVPVFCSSLHAGDPGIEGTNAVSTLIDAAVDRSQITMAAASGSGSSNTGDPATWVVDLEAPTTATHLALWDALSSGNCMGRVVLDQPTLLADGDTVHLSTFTSTMPES